MTPIPFDQIGPSQVGRLVYQVIGKNGPIFNPSNISYLDPSTAGLSGSVIAGAAPALAGVAGLSLVASVAAAGLSAAALQECRKIRKGMDRIETKLGDLGDQMSRIEERVERIDIKVAESHLREAVRHLTEKAIGEDSIDLIELSRLSRDLEAFRESYEVTTLFNFAIQLSSDVRDKLDDLLQLLYSLRVSTVIAHNGALDGDPFRTIAVDPIGDYLPCNLKALVDFAAAMGRDDLVFFKFAEALGEKVENHFTWAGEEENEEFQLFCVDHYFHPQNEAMSTTLTSAAAMLLTVCAESALPDLDYELESAEEHLEALARTWFLESDASIIFRLESELRGIANGYEKEFYSNLDWVNESDGTEKGLATESLYFQNFEN